MFLFCVPGLKVPFTPHPCGITLNSPSKTISRRLCSCKAGNAEGGGSKDVQMRARVRQRRNREHMSRNECVRVEIQSFLQALSSYADRVARDPEVTFEEHHVSLMPHRRNSALSSGRSILRQY